MSKKRSFWGVVLIPLAYVLTSFAMDLAMFIIIRAPFPVYYAVSFLFLLAFAGVVSLIPNRWVQIGIFIACIAMQMVTSVSNLIAYNNLGEIFIFETLRSFREIFAGKGSAKYQGGWHYTILGTIVASFVGVCIFIGIKFRRQKAGWPMRNIAAVGAAVMFAFAGVFTHLAAIDNRHEKSNFQLLVDPRFSLANFTNRHMALYSFGSPTFYFNNLLSMIGLKSMASIAVSGEVDMAWDGEDYYAGYVNEENESLLLDADTNLIMLMMETVEFDAIDEILTPALWKVKKMSTWIDGYYAIERTCFSEFLSLTGGAGNGAEPWRDYSKLNVPQSLPNVFRRSFEAANEKALAEGGEATPISIGAYHPYSSEFYSREWFFDKSILGFDSIKDLSNYGQAIAPDWHDNDDELFMQKAVHDIAPKDTRFFSYYLNISTHAGHFGKDTKNKRFGTSHTWLDTTTKEIHSIYTDSLNYIKSKPELLDTFPRLKSEDLSIRAATWAYLVSVHQYDKSIGVLLKHLEDNELMDSTALVFYSDHFNYMAYNNSLNKAKGSVLSREAVGAESPIGEKLSFMIYNPKDNKKERKITGFTSNNDIYKTVCHLYGIETHEYFTLGSSVLARLYKPDADVSVGIGFYNGMFFGYDLDNPDLHFTTRDFKKFTTNTKAKPSPETILAYMTRLETYAGTLFKLRSHYDDNSFKDDPWTRYIIGGRPPE